MKTAVKIITENYKEMDYIHFGAWLEENIEPLLEKEKQQIIEAYKSGDLGKYDMSAEQYYNEIFKD